MFMQKGGYIRQTEQRETKEKPVHAVNLLIRP